MLLEQTLFQEGFKYQGGNLEQVPIFFYFPTKTYVVGTYQKHLTEALLIRTHNICFCGGISKILCEYSLLSGAIFLSAKVVTSFRMSTKSFRSIHPP